MCLRVLFIGSLGAFGLKRFSDRDKGVQEGIRYGLHRWLWQQMMRAKHLTLCKMSLFLDLTCTRYCYMTVLLDSLWFIYIYILSVTWMEFVLSGTGRDNSGLPVTNTVNKTKIEAEFPPEIHLVRCPVRGWCLSAICKGLVFFVVTYDYYI